MMRSAAIAVLLTVTACAPGGKGKDEDPTAAELMGLVALSVTPGQASLYSMGDHADLVCFGLYADGTSKPQIVEWSVDSGAVTLSSSSGSTVTATAAGTAATTVIATFSGLVGHAVVLAGAAAVTDPGTIYGGDSLAGALYQYPGDPMASPIQLASLPTYQGNGLMLDASGAFLYAISYDATNEVGSYSIYRCDTAGGQVSVFAPLPYGEYHCLDRDPRGNLYTLQWDTGNVVKITPTGTVTLHCNSGVDFMLGMAIGWDPAQQRDDVPFYFPIFSFSPHWIFRQDFASSQAVAWAEPPPGLWFEASGGLAIDRDGVVYSTSLASNEVWRYRDDNGNGYGDDPGERKVFAILPFEMGSGAWEYISPSIARGGSLLVHVGTFGQLMPADAGVYWIVDRDPAHDGATQMAEEVTRVHPQWMDGSNSGSFQYLAARR